MDEDLQKLIEAAMADDGSEVDLEGDPVLEESAGEGEAERHGTNVDVEELVFTLRQIATAVIDLKDQVEEQMQLVRQAVESCRAVETLPAAMEAVTAKTDALREQVNGQQESVDNRLEQLAEAVAENQRLLRELDTPASPAAADGVAAEAPRQPPAIARPVAQPVGSVEDLVDTARQQPGDEPDSAEDDAAPAEEKAPAAKQAATTRPRIALPKKAPEKKEPSSSGSQDFGADTAKLVSPFRIKETAKKASGETSTIRARAVPSVREEKARRDLSETARMLLNGRGRTRDKAPPEPTADDESDAPDTEPTDAPAPAPDRTTQTEKPRRLSLARPNGGKKLARPIGTSADETDGDGATAVMTETEIADAAVAVADEEETTVAEPEAVVEGPPHTGDVPLHPAVASLQKLVFNLKIATSQVLRSRQVPRGGKLNEKVAAILSERSNALLRESLSRHNKCLGQAQVVFEQTPAAKGTEPALFWNDELVGQYTDFRTDWFIRQVLDKLETAIRKHELDDHWPLLEALAMEMELARIEIRHGQTVYDAKRHQTRDGQQPRSGDLYHAVIKGDFRSGYVDLGTGKIVRKAVVRVAMVARNP